MKQPTILVTGVSGFSGGYIDGYLRNKGYRTISHWGRVIGDLSETRTFSSWIAEFTKTPDIIIHIAAQSPAPAITNTDIYKNIPAGYNIIQYAKKVGVKKIIYFSSDSVYGFVNGIELFADDFIIQPNFYGQTKIVCEKLLADSMIPTIALRLPLIVGRGAKRNWLARIMSRVKAGKPVTIYNPDSLFNNVVHIHFLSELIEKLITKDWPNAFDIIIPTATNPLTVRQVVSKIVNGKVEILESSSITKSYTISTKTIEEYNPWTVERTIDQYVRDES